MRVDAHGMAGENKALCEIRTAKDEDIRSSERKRLCGTEAAQPETSLLVT